MEPRVFSSGKMRSARGFSTLELKKARIDVRIAKRLGLRVDFRRKTAYDENIKLIKEKLEDEKKKREIKKKTKKGKVEKAKKVPKSKKED
ncbi:MAG: ribosomal protein L13e [Thermoplasmata archaeon]|nr:MAG: ribosomal protein L13e [Thermoplasmata archaeon]